MFFFSSKTIIDELKYPQMEEGIYLLATHITEIIEEPLSITGN